MSDNPSRLWHLGDAKLEQTLEHGEIGDSDIRNLINTLHTRIKWLEEEVRSFRAQTAAGPQLANIEDGNVAHAKE